MRSDYARRGLAVSCAVVGLCLLGFGALIYAFFVWLAYDQSGAAELCQARLSGPSGVGEPEATTKPGFFPISARCEWSGKVSDIELVSARTTVIPVVIMGAGVVTVAAGGVVFWGRSGGG
ncbi:hypothetical protein GCM10022235_44460 [Kribbella ginsengisoli]|uniref:Uncharacterized protein n=2 Tax=Kribbella ginsengisoli TaxID=363865 RepID=A0ABP6XPT1_9ACTN